MNLGSLSVSTLHVPTDWILLAVFALIVALDTYRSGSARAVTLTLVAPLTMILITVLPQAIILGPLSQQFSAPAAQTLLFGVIFAVLFLVMHRIVYSFSENGGALQAPIAALAATAVLAVVWLQAPALVYLWHFGPQVQLVFGEGYRFWWLLGAYVALSAIRG